jgi:predicted Zn-dependent protease
MPFRLGHGGGRGFNMRWIVALVIAGIGVITYFSRTQTNPVTGEKQRVALTVEQEKALGLQAAPQMVAEMNARILEPARDPRAALVREVGMKLVSTSDANRSPYVGNFNFHLLDDDLVNAFALPGGQIFITTTLFDQLENEAQLAGVLGHEIGHVIHRHSAEHMAKGQLGQSIVGAVAVGASGEDGGGQMAAAAAAMANQMLQLKYGRNDETESDRTGIDYMADAGYDPREMLGVMQVLKKASGGRGGMEWMQSHPLPDTRLKDIEQTVNASFKPEQLAKLTKGRPLTEAGVRTAGERERERW